MEKIIYYFITNLSGIVGISDNSAVIPTLKTTDVRNKITAALQRNATIQAEKISISAKGNKVILSGKVRSYAEKKDAENTAWLAPGVTKVENKLEIDTEMHVFK